MEPNQPDSLLVNKDLIEEVITEKLYPMEDVRNLLDRLLDIINPGMQEGTFVYTILSLAIVLGFTVLTWLLLRLLFVSTLPKLMERIPFLSGSIGYSTKIVRKVIAILSVAIFSGLLPVVWPEPNIWYNLLKSICRILEIWMVAQLIAHFLNVARRNMIASPKYSNSPFINLFQVFKGIVYFIAVLKVISVLFNMDMTAIGAGLTALSAVLMLVFKDTILGFVASIQLSSNDMIRVGDWITVPAFGVDGDVIDISLATIKVKNFDKTVSTIPPYSMLTEAVQNWRPMQEDGGRRVKRSIYVDVQSIKYADKDLLDKLRTAPALNDYIETALSEIEKANKEQGLEHSYSRRGLTNIGLYRRYIELYLKNHSKVHPDFTCMVRQLQPTAQGLPLELYFFTNTTNWTEYEGIQSDVFDHLLAVIHVFELSVFQEINGHNVSQYLDYQAHKDETKSSPADHNKSVEA
ncbi:MAG: mechanosensitive ion channel [Porphyromonas sp.]|nr:mechanosensitive ion channel [Porphyromonas sp.]